MYVDRFDNDYQTVDFHYVIVSPETVAEDDYADDDGETDEEAYNAAVDAAYEAAKTKAAAIDEAWAAVGYDNDKLETVLEPYADDTNVSSGELTYYTKTGGDVQELYDWLFDSARAEGDHTVIPVRDLEDETDTGVVYMLKFDGLNDTARKHVAEEAMLTAYITEWNSGLTADLTITKIFGYRFVEGGYHATEFGYVQPTPTPETTPTPEASPTPDVSPSPEETETPDETETPIGEETPVPSETPNNE